MPAGLLSLLAMGLMWSCDIGINPEDDDDTAALAPLRVEPDFIDFGHVTLSNGSIERFDIFNETGVDIALTSLSFSPALDEFDYVSPPENGTVLMSGESRTINVKYLPMVEDELNTTAIVNTDHPDYPPLEVALHGCSLLEGCEGAGDDDDDDSGDDDDDDDDDSGACGTISVQPTSIDFGTVSTGTTANETVTITNTGNADLDINGIAQPGSPFTVTGLSTPVTIGAGQSEQFTAQFSPTAAGPNSGSIVITSCDESSPQLSIPVQGLGDDSCGQNCFPEIDIDPTNLDFGDLTGGSTSLVVTVSNVGIDPLHLSGFQGTTSAAGGTVTVTGNTTATIQPANQLTFQIEWTPGAMLGGNDCLDVLTSGSDYLTLLSDDADEGVLYIPLDGCCDGTGEGFCGMADFVMCLSNPLCDGIIERGVDG